MTKKRKVVKRLEARIKGYNETVATLNEKQRAGYHKPGSLKK